MNLSLPRLALILAAAAVLGYLLGRDGPAPDPQPEPVADAAPRSATAPAWSAPPAPVYGEEGATPPQTPAWSQRSQAFRPLPEATDRPSAYPSAGAPYRAPDQLAPQAPRSAQPDFGAQPPPYHRPERFRPLEDQEQTRRWRGGYRQMSTNPAQYALPGGFNRQRALAGPS